MTLPSPSARKALLPAGLSDLLPPDAEHEAQTVGRLMKVFHAHGYERVKPPLVEFEDALLSGPGAALARQTFRIMDPVSQTMMGLRSDMTPQVARIATTRLAKAARPLRLSYAGQVLRVKGTQLRPERQVGQVGAELIGADAPAADAEIVLLAASGLAAVGAQGITIDLALPTVVGVLAQAAGLSGEQRVELRAALERRDPVEVAKAGGSAGATLAALLAAGGPVAQALEKLSRIDLPPEAAAERARLAEAARRIAMVAPDLILTVDPVEQRGFEYQTGLSFTVFAKGVSGELGRGGRYLSGEPGAAEPATGFTLYTDTVLRALPGPAPRRRILLPDGTGADVGAALRAEGWQTLAALSDDPSAEAQQLGCGHVWRDGTTQQVG